MLTDQNGGNGMVMPVSPMYGGNGGSGFFGGDWAWIILLLLIGGNGWGFGGFGGAGMMMPWMMGGMGGFGMDYLYPWLNNSQHISDGFRDQQLNTQIAGLGNQLNTLQLGQCQTGNAITGAVRDGTYALNNTMQGGFANLAAGTADLKYTVSQEACADRNALAMSVRDVMENCNRNNQAVLDKLCQLELDNVKGQLAQAQRDNVGLQNQLNMATMRESQIAQTAAIKDGQAAQTEAIYNRLSQCPVPSTPVYGRTPIFSCNNNGGCGCNGNGFAYT